MSRCDAPATYYAAGTLQIITTYFTNGSAPSTSFSLFASSDAGAAWQAGHTRLNVQGCAPRRGIQACLRPLVPAQGALATPARRVPPLTPPWPPRCAHGLEQRTLPAPHQRLTFTLPRCRVLLYLLSPPAVRRPAVGLGPGDAAGGFVAGLPAQEPGAPGRQAAGRLAPARRPAARVVAHQALPAAARHRCCGRGRADARGAGEASARALRSGSRCRAPP